MPVEYPADVFLREKQIIGDRSVKPHVPGLIPISKQAWHRGIAAGRYPAPTKLGPKICVWRASEIYAFIATYGKDGAKADEV